MEKLSSAQIAQVLQDAAYGLRVMAAERDAALQKLASMSRRADAEKLAAQMHDKGIELDKDFTVLADDLEKAAEEGRLSVIQQAVDYVGPNMSLKTGSISDESRFSGGNSDLERFIVGDVG
jgi:hypothetical protein